MNSQVKPSAQVVGVAGFKSDLYANDIEKVDWHILINLPKFQMFCVEKSKRSVDNVMQWIMGFVQDQCYKDEQAFFDNYVQWHNKKGYWSNETVYGDLINDP